MDSGISVHLPDKLKRELDRISKETKRSLSFHIQKAIELYIEEFTDMQIALDRLNDSTDSMISNDEIRAQLGTQIERGNHENDY